LAFAAVSTNDSFYQSPKFYKNTLKASSSDDEGFFSGLEINLPYALAYVGFLGFAYFMTTVEAPGASQLVLDKFLADPVNPGVNELFASVFNLLGLVAIPLACLVMPGAKGQKLPAAPFLLGGAFAGYGSVGKWNEPFSREIQAIRSLLIKLTID
jgi:hypothetical protein